MARTWARPDLTGTKNGTNKDFSIPSLQEGARVWLIFNGTTLYEVALSPGNNEFSRTGASVALGLAPEANDTLWAYTVLDEAAEASEAGAPSAFVQEIRKTFYYNVELFDKAGLRREILERDISASAWSYYGIGGCGEADIVLRRPYDDFGETALDWGVEIWRERDVLGKAGARLPAQFIEGPGGDAISLGTAHTGGRELRWGGFVREIQRVMADDEQVVLKCAGWSRQLAYIFLPEQDTPWVDMDVGAIVRDIIDRFVLAGSKIKRTASLGLVPDTGVIVNQINFDTPVFDALRVLGEIAGNAEWGVRPDKEFYFIQPTTTVKQTHVIGDRIALYSPRTNTDEIVNRVYLRGANGFKASLTIGPVEDGYYKERRELVAAIQTAEVATLWGASYAARFASSQPSGQLQLAQTDDWIESVGHPLGLLRVIGAPMFVAPGDRFTAQLPMRLAATYGRQTDERYRVASIRYQAVDDALTVDVGLGQRKNPLSDLHSTINFKLNELQQAAGL